MTEHLPYIFIIAVPALLSASSVLYNSSKTTMRPSVSDVYYTLALVCFATSVALCLGMVVGLPTGIRDKVWLASGIAGIVGAVFCFYSPRISSYDAYLLVSCLGRVFVSTSFVLLVYGSL